MEASKPNQLEKGYEVDSKMDAVAQDFASRINVLEADIEKALKLLETRQLGLHDKIKLDSYLAYLCSTMYWMHLKLQGVDVSKHDVLHDLERSKEMMARDRQINASLSASRLDMPAAKRFIAAGMHIKLDNPNPSK